MLRGLRRKLRRVSYYSRTRERTIWTRAIDAALPVSLMLALPTALTAEGLGERARLVEEVSGVLIGDPDTDVQAPMLGEDRRWNHDNGIPYGEWTLNRHSVTRGWPFPSKLSRSPSTVDFNIYDEARTRVNVQLDRDAPERVAIERSLAQAGRSDLRDGWGRSRAVVLERDWLLSTLNAAAWWVGLFATSAIMIRVLSFMSLVKRAKRADATRSLTRTGICSSCKYDLRGLEFNERCPECGTLIEA